MRIKIENAVVSFAQGLFTPSTVKGGNGAPKFGAHFLIYPDTKVYDVSGDKPVLTTIHQAELDVGALVFGKRAAAILPTLAPKQQKAIRSGDLMLRDDGTVSAGYEGCVYVAAKAKTYKPVYDQDPSRPLLTVDSGKPRSGDRVDVLITLYGYADPSKRGIFASLEGTQYRCRGTPMGGAGTAVKSDFSLLSVDAVDAKEEEEEEGLVAGQDEPVGGWSNMGEMGEDVAF